MLSIFSDECFIISPSCAAEDACNGEGGGSSTGRRSVKIIFSSSFLKERVSVTLGNNHRATSEGGN